MIYEVKSMRLYTQKFHYQSMNPYLFDVKIMEILNSIDQVISKKKGMKKIIEHRSCASVTFASVSVPRFGFGTQTWCRQEITRKFLDTK